MLLGQRLASVEPRRADLRKAIPVDLRQRMTGATVTRLSRRAKYGLIDTDRGDTLVFHLGMSGRWRVDPSAILPHDHLLPTAYEWARRLADGPTLALSMTKRMVNNEWNMDMASALEAEAQAQALLMMGEDHRIFYEAFHEKAQPKFTGR